MNTTQTENDWARLMWEVASIEAARRRLIEEVTA
jgi:hypothetical protein